MIKTLNLDKTWTVRSANTGGAFRTYLFIGGDERERGLVAGNVARAAGTTYRSVRLRDAGAADHACAAHEALRKVLSQAPTDGSILLIEDADPLFSAPVTEARCSACRAVDMRGLIESMRKTGGTFLFGVDSAPADMASGKWTDWRPDVVVYLAPPVVKPREGPGKLRVRFGSTSSPRRWCD